MKIEMTWAVLAAAALSASAIACASGAGDDTASGAGAETVNGSSGANGKPASSAATSSSGSPAPVATSAEAGTATAASLCTATEKALFQCSLGGSGAVAVCASSDLSATTGYLQYRMVAKGQAPSSLPADEVRGQFRSYTSAATLMFSGGGGAYIRFGTDDSPFVVYTAIGHGFDESGVAIENGGQLLTSLKCTDDPHSQLGDDLFTSAGLPAGQPSLDFDLPTPP